MGRVGYHTWADLAQVVGRVGFTEWTEMVMGRGDLLPDGGIEGIADKSLAAYKLPPEVMQPISADVASRRMTKKAKVSVRSHYGRT